MRTITQLKPLTFAAMNEDRPFIWYPVERTPTVMTADPPPGYSMLLELESGYLASGEFSHEDRCFYVWAERYEEGELPPFPEAVNDYLDWALEECETVRRWMWIKR